MRKGSLLLGALALVAATGVAFARGDGFRNIREFLTGYEEVATGIAAISTTGRGRLNARINSDESEITYTLSYEDLEGSVLMSHIHFGQKSTAGGISVWLCQTATNQAPESVRDTTPICPSPGGSVSGTLNAASVIGPAGQGIEPGAFAELIAAIRAGTTYVNVHSSKWPSGEIRAQIERGHEGH